MSALQLLANAGAVITTVMGLLGLFRPLSAAAFVGVEPQGLMGTSELRATYGGVFVGLGGFCLLSQSPMAFACAGAAWLGAAMARLLSVAIDRNFAGKNFAAIAYEAAIGGLLVAGAL